MKLRKLIIILALFALAVPVAALASGPEDVIESGEVINDDLVIRETTILEEGAVVNGDLTVFSSDIDLHGDVNGNVVVFGGDVTISGSVSGDLTVFGGSIEIADSAMFDGSCALFGGMVEGVTDCFNPVTSEINLQSLTEFVTASDFRTTTTEAQIFDSDGSGFISQSLSIVLAAFIVGTMGFFITSAVPARMYEMRSAVTHNPYMAGGIGMLTAIAGSSFLILTSWLWIPILVLLSFVCGIGLFMGFAGIFYMGAMVLMGWITVGALLAGRFVDQSSPLNPNDPLIAAVGTGIVTLAFGLLAIPFPVITVLLVSVLFFVGLGGVVLTRIGKQAYPRIPSDVDHDKFRKVMDTLPK